MAKLKSWPLWLAIGSLIVFIAKQFFAADIEEPVNNFLTVLLPVLIGFGVVNNPDTREKI